MHTPILSLGHVSSIWLRFGTPKFYYIENTLLKPITFTLPSCSMENYSSQHNLFLSLTTSYWLEFVKLTLASTPGMSPCLEQDFPSKDSLSGGLSQFWFVKALYH